MQDELRYVAGLDLGRTRNYTALAVRERRWHGASPREFIASETRGYQGEYRYRVVGWTGVRWGLHFRTR